MALSEWLWKIMCCCSGGENDDSGSSGSFERDTHRLSQDQRDVTATEEEEIPMTGATQGNRHDLDDEEEQPVATDSLLRGKAFCSSSVLVEEGECMELTRPISGSEDEYVELPQRVVLSSTSMRHVEQTVKPMGTQEADETHLKLSFVGRETSGGESVVSPKEEIRTIQAKRDIGTQTFEDGQNTTVKNHVENHARSETYEDDPIPVVSHDEDGALFVAENPQSASVSQVDAVEPERPDVLEKEHKQSTAVGQLEDDYSEYLIQELSEENQSSPRESLRSNGSVETQKKIEADTSSAFEGQDKESSVPTERHLLPAGLRDTEPLMIQSNVRSIEEKHSLEGASFAYRFDKRELPSSSPPPLSRTEENQVQLRDTPSLSALSIHDTSTARTDHQAQPPDSPNENAETGRHLATLINLFEVMMKYPTVFTAFAKKPDQSREECALVHSMKAWSLLMGQELPRAQKILAAVQILDVRNPLICLAHNKVRSLLLLLTGDKATLQLVVRLTEELLSHSFSPGVSGQAGWVFLHQALASMPDAVKYYWMRKAQLAFLKDMGCLSEAKHGSDITRFISTVWANAEGRWHTASTASHRDTAVHTFYKRLAVQQLCD